MASTASHTKPPRRFAPLNKSNGNNSDAPQLKGVIFDVDGTLCLPQNYMFRQMRAALGIPKTVDILGHIQSLSSKNDQNFSSPRSRAQDAIKLIEREAMSSQAPQPGLNELITRLAGHDLRLALCTRNFAMPVHHLLDKFVSEEGRKHFSPLITRETENVQPKPSPEGIWACVQAWDSAETSTGALEPVVDGKLRAISEEDKIRSCEGVIMVGDSVDDIEAGARAGAATVLLVNEDNKHLLEEREWPRKVDLTIGRLDELADVLETGFCGRE